MNSIIHAVSAVAWWILLTGSWNLSANAYLLVPDPPLAEQLTAETYEEFLKSTDKTAIVFAYPSAAVFGQASIMEFAVVTKMLEGNTKCKLGMYQINLTINSPIEMMKASLSYLKDGELVSMPGEVNKVAGIMSWITRERICDMRLQSIDSARYYLRALERGHVHTLLIMREGYHDPKLEKQIYDTIMDTGLSTPFMVADRDDIIRHTFKTHRLSEDAMMPVGLMITRNTSRQHPIKFLYENLNDMDVVRDFLFKELVPPVHDTNSFMLNEVVKMHKTMVYIYTKEDNLEDYIDLDWLNSFALENKDKFIFIHSKGDDTVEERLNHLLVIDSDYVETAVRAFELHPEKMEFVKFRPLDLPDGTLTQTHLIKFINDLREGKIRHFVKSEMAIPESIDVGHVKTIVGEDFHGRVIDSDRDVLMLFFSPWCGHCHQAKRVFRELGRRLQGIDSVVVAKFDAYNNEVENTTFTAYPTILLYQHGAKHNPIEYVGELTIEALAKFLESECRRDVVKSSTILERELEHEQLFERHTEL
ncbi:Protein disulfide-isomerase [Babesia sp. Xinjiang]|uniref:Protein disulfide-isomerase n=1 Tax=Babesia sp. Xinjiang TaxID=462227 RepID=UPI000A24666F|nr:Protein disulfide-isomerase [Babesia sp. Xinjiang]ORM40338.1 Protein disulfide-isomerase [Babesia sp. Xinjiang]